MSLIIKKYISSFIDENTYIIIDEATRKAAVVDPGVYSDEIAECLSDCELEYVLLTHGHGDHIKDINLYIDNYPGVKVVAGEDEVEFLADPNLNGTATMTRTPISVKVDIATNDDTELSLGDVSLRFVQTPGHTPGGQCIIADNYMFSGDTLFFMSVGATHFPGGDWDTLKASIQNKLFALDDEIIVLPGHGGKTSIGYEKRANPFV